MMRKVFVILMTVCLLMGAFAVLPVSAINDEASPSEIDGSTVADAEDLNLVVTEFMSNTTCSVAVGGQNVQSENAFQYIEIYNRGATAVNLYNLAIVRSNNLNSASLWNTSHRFEQKIPLDPGNVSIQSNVSATNQRFAVVNPNRAVLEPGEFAIIWFWNDASVKVSNALGNSLGADTITDGKIVYHKAFRDHYKAENSSVSISDDLLIVAAYAGSTTDSSRFALNTSNSYMYALVKDERTAGFDVNFEVAFTANKGSDGTIYQRNDKVVCLWQWGTWTKQSIPSGNNYEGLASVYVPANCTPDFRNASNKAIWGDDYWREYTNYYELGLVDGFKEVALVNFTEKPTIGTMDAWQWAYVDPERAPESAKSLAANGKTWQQIALDAYIAANVEVGEEVAEHPEEKIDIKPITVAGDASVASLASNDFLKVQNSTFSTENALVQGVGITTSFALAAVLELWRRGIARH